MLERKTPRHQDVVDDVKDFFRNDKHWIYTSPGTQSNVSPNSVFHVSQLQVLFEPKYFHDVTHRAVSELRRGFLRSQRIYTESISPVLVWRPRYAARKIQAHLDLLLEYSHPTIHAATGAYAETLVDLVLSKLGLERVARDTKSYQGRTWTETNHDLDFIFEGNCEAFGVEVKNTFDYMPDDELDIKLNMCAYLGIRPLFFVRNRKYSQWKRANDYNGLIFMFQSKVFPPGQDQIVKSIWEEMRLPVAIWRDWPDGVYKGLRRQLAL